MGEIGGFFEFEYYNGEMLHGDGIRLDSGRNCLLYLIKSRDIKKIVLPIFLCDCIENICHENDVSIRYYSVGIDFLPEDLELSDGEWLYLVNYYGQLTENQILDYKKRYDRIIVDNAHAYFSQPLEGIDTLYTCRKFFGVTDGGVLFTDYRIDVNEQDESFKRLIHLVGRFERTASEFYDISLENEEHFYGTSIMLMSKFTENVLRSLNYESIRQKRHNNFEILHDGLYSINELKLTIPNGPFMYPLMIENAKPIREMLISKKVYVPVIWPNVIKNNSPDSIEYVLSSNILPIPCDHRYGSEEMTYVINLIKRVA